MNFNDVPFGDDDNGTSQSGTSKQADAFADIEIIDVTDTLGK